MTEPAPSPSRTIILALAGVLALAALLPLGIPAEAGEQDPLSSPFVGITTDGEVIPGLFPIRATGVSTGPVREAADAFLAGLTPDQHERTTFPVDDLEWRMWSNTSGYTRQGVSFSEMDEAQRELAFGLLRAGLSARGFETARDIMRLNGHLAWLLDNPERYGEWLYWITVMGEPHPTEPWGWQLDGHHLVVNYFVLGDQVVMTPAFWGSEPTTAEEGPYAGIEILREEQTDAITFMEMLTPDQREQAVLETSKPANNALAQAFRDNLELDHAGIRASELNAAQRAALVQLIGLYVGQMADGHARVRMEEVVEHLDATWFAWIGEVHQDAIFYYRIHSPVILIEFDHQLPVALPGDRVPNRRHIHAVVRTPNAGDYGKDLLRQHYEAHADDPEHGHVHAGEGGHTHPHPDPPLRPRSR
jgi:hypothetical protein